MEKGVKIIFIMFNVFLNLIICVPVHNNIFTSSNTAFNQTFLKDSKFLFHIHHETYVGQLGLVLNWLDWQLTFLHSIEENIYNCYELTDDIIDQMNLRCKYKR